MSIHLYIPVVATWFWCSTARENLCLVLRSCRNDKFLTCGQGFTDWWSLSVVGTLSSFSILSNKFAIHPNKLRTVFGDVRVKVTILKKSADLTISQEALAINGWVINVTNLQALFQLTVSKLPVYSRKRSKHNYSTVNKLLVYSKRNKTKHI